jgi:hypothetical protein
MLAFKEFELKDISRVSFFRNCISFGREIYLFA